MPGIYLHIPFCKKACHYCNFHFSTNVRLKADMVEAILQEIEWRKDFLEIKPLDSIYFGGGTPSLLSAKELDKIFNTIYRLFSIQQDAEITLEANPDDLTPSYLEQLKISSVNRLSIGIQSFREECLQWMNRSHTAFQSRKVLSDVFESGFENITIDLIFGTPTLSDKQWEENLLEAFSYPIHHLSCYNLTIEEKTALHHFVKTGKNPPVDEEQSFRQFELLMDIAPQYGFEQYEISNFARQQKYAVHNTSYWKGEPYLGVGPAAHSYDGKNTRYWNIANNALYIKSLQGDLLPLEKEVLTEANRYNEYVMTTLRTYFGCDIHVLTPQQQEHFKTLAQPYLQNGELLCNEGTYTLSKKGKMIADQIAADLFW